MNDHQLIDYFKSNEEHNINYAYKQIYDQYFKLVCFIISKYVENYQDIEDLSHDIFTNLYIHRKNLDENKKLKYYLSASAKNAAINYCRQKKEITLDIDSIKNDFDTQNYHSNENYLSIINELSVILSEQEVDILIKHIVEDYTFAELSKVYAMSINTIKSQYLRAIKKFKKWRKNK